MMEASLLLKALSEPDAADDYKDNNDDIDFSKVLNRGEKAEHGKQLRCIDGNKIFVTILGDASIA